MTSRERPAPSQELIEHMNNLFGQPYDIRCFPDNDIKDVSSLAKLHQYVARNPGKEIEVTWFYNTPETDQTGLGISALYRASVFPSATLLIRVASNRIFYSNDTWNKLGDVVEKALKEGLNIRLEYDVTPFVKVKY